MCECGCVYCGECCFMCFSFCSSPFPLSLSHPPSPFLITWNWYILQLNYLLLMVRVVLLESLHRNSTMNHQLPHQSVWAPLFALSNKPSRRWIARPRTDRCEIWLESLLVSLGFATECPIWVSAYLDWPQTPGKENFLVELQSYAGVSWDSGISLLTLNTWKASNWILRDFSFNIFIISFKFSGFDMYFVITCVRGRNDIGVSWRELDVLGALWSYRKVVPIQ